MNKAGNPFDAGFDLLLNHRPIEVRKDPHHSKECLAGWRGSVDALLVKEQFHLRVQAFPISKLTWKR